MKHGLDTFFCFGLYSESHEDHHWVRHGDYIYDATASQFEGVSEDIVTLLESEAKSYQEQGFIFINSNLVNELISDC